MHLVVDSFSFILPREWITLKTHTHTHHVDVWGFEKVSYHYFIVFAHLYEYFYFIIFSFSI